VEGRDVDDVVDGAAGRFQHGLEVVEGELNLTAEVGLGRSVRPAADLSGHEQQIAGANGGGVSVRFIKGVPVGREDGVTLGHVDLALLLDWDAGTAMARLPALHRLIYDAYVN